MHMAQNNRVLWKWNIVKRPMLSAPNAANLQYIVISSYVFVFPMILITCRQMVVEHFTWSDSLIWCVYNKIRNWMSVPYRQHIEFNFMLCYKWTVSNKCCCFEILFYFIWAVLLEMWCHNGSNFVWKKLFQHFICSLTIMLH